MSAQLIHGDCLAVLPTLPDASVDAVITDPPYAEISRPYGRLTEAAWHDLMHEVVRQVRRVLAPTGSAMLVLQPNSAHVGQMRAWVWEFLAWCCREWNVVQDAYWWNFTAPPTVHTQRTRGLMRPSLKYCVWLGNPTCYRRQDAVLWEESMANVAARKGSNALVTQPSGTHKRAVRMGTAALERGGTTPFNLLPIANSDSSGSAGAHGHGAGTPYALCDWWVRYIVPPGGTVLDPFSGTATVGLAALAHGHSFVGIEQDAGYHAIAQARIDACQPSLLAGVS